MEKIKKIKNIGDPIHFSPHNYYPIEYVANYLQLAVKNGATTIYIDYEREPDDYELVAELIIQPFKIREKTDSEFEKRKEEIKREIKELTEQLNRLSQ